MVLIGFGADVTILGYGHHAFFEAYAEYLILQLHAESLECIDVALPHCQEHLVQEMLRVFLVLLDPLDETVRALDVLVYSRTFQDRVKGLLRITLDYVLLVGHQLDYALQDREFAQALTQRL